MIQVSELHSHYGLSHVIQGVSLGVEAGKVLGVFGRNGVGKTTLLKNIAGWVRPTSGSITLDGQEIGGKAPDAINRAGLIGHRCRVEHIDIHVGGMTNRRKTETSENCQR